MIALIHERRTIIITGPVRAYATKGTTMTKMIAVVSQKGGPGKSTVARMAAVAYAAAGWDTLLLDTDTHQATSCRWMARRQGAELTTANLSVVEHHSISREAEFDMVIVDGAPHATKQTVSFAQKADLVLIPSGVSVDDLAPAASLALALATHHGVEKERIRFVLNRVGAKQSETQSAILALEETGIQVMPSMLRESLCYRTAMDNGLALHEVSYAAPKRSATALVNDIADLMEKLA